ncbi:MAG: hypothetical protein QOF19_1819 [Alphaproteobacteria bacterium]|nr:hypothetical protein [Alphaproteobacteria bacterium]
MDRSLARAIEWDCTQLVFKFYGYLDENRYAEMAELFTKDGVWVRLGKEVRGPANIRALEAERENWLTAHLVTNVRINILDPKRAETVQYVTLYRHENWEPSAGPAPVVLPLAILRHQDQLANDGGIWKFKRKTSRAIMADRSRVTHYEKR